MERFNGSEHRTTETYVIQGADSNPHLTTTPPLEEITVMDNEMAPEFIVDQGPYYPTAANYYGYYCTGFESPNEWEDHHSFFGLDGPDVHYTGMQTESLPYVYYTPTYGYAQSPYNPYNPYIPGAIVGVDGPFVGSQQYYTGPTYQHPVSSPAYLPVFVQPRPDIPNPSVEPTLVNLAASSTSKPDGAGLKYAPPTTSTGLAMHPPRAGSGEARLELSQSVSHQVRSSVKVSEGSQASLAPSKQPASYGTNTSSGIPNSTSSHVTQGRNASGAVQAADPLSFGRVQSLRHQLKVTVPANTDFGSNAQGWSAADKIRPMLQLSSGVLNNGNGGPDILGEQNRGPRTNRIKGPWTPSMSVKAYTTKAGASNAQGNTVIYADQYNRDDFPVNYPNAKFFVIKSYSEDDVHKSIKYNVWSSTPVGNKRLDSVYEDAHRISGGRPGNCPVFLFFSVNASGQFCGVAEMIGPVDFQKDMDFWQQDKWNGSFPVKWHIVKDVPNTNFRHIILENNENKPVTNSRDTQEIRYMQGMEMLKIFKTYSSKTSILDDFMYYENRQKLMQEEKTRQMGKNYDATSFFLPAFVPSTTPSVPVNQSPKVDSRPINQPLKVDKKRTNQLLNADEKPIIEPPKADEKHINQLLKVDGKPINQPPKVDEKPTKDNDMNKLVKMLPKGEQVVSKLEFSHSSICEKETQHKAVEGVKDVMKIGSLSIDPKDSKESETNISEPLSETAGCTTGPVDVVTVGSMPVKVNGFSESSSSILTVGSIPIDPKAVKLKK